MTNRSNWLLRLVLLLALLWTPTVPLQADLRSVPAWYDSNAVAVTPDWHYRVPISVPATGSVNSTVKLDVDFAALLSALGVVGTFDSNSVRVVRSTGALAAVQEYSDTIYGAATDAVGNARGEVRFLLQDAGPVTYALYFDVTENGSKPANPQSPINGNFEVGATGTSAPTGWTAPTVTAGIDAQMRPSETVSVTGSPTPVDGVTVRSTDGTPSSGAFSYLIGNRSSAAGGIAGAPSATLTRDIVVPSTNPGSISFRYRPEGWDTGDFDPVRIELSSTANATLVEMVGPTAGAYTTKPFAPNVVNGAASNTSSGYRQYNGFDCTLTGTHLQGMTMPCHSEPWFTVTQSLAAYAGTTIRIRIRFSSDTSDKTWLHLDDFEWAAVVGTLGIPEAFGVNITTPATGGTYMPGQVIPVTAQVDANPTAATNPMSAAIFDSAGTQIASGFTLYNDGTHGDAVAGDAIWSNNNSVPAQPAPTVPGTAPTATGYVLRLFARDATSNSLGAPQNGLAHIPATATGVNQANYWNVDDIIFAVQRADLQVTKVSFVIDDPVNGATNPKMIPGARVRYCLLVTNPGPFVASTISITDAVPATLSYIAGSMRSGASCASAATVEDDDATGADESDPDGASYSAPTISAKTGALASGASLAISFDATIQ
jgi:uncharacterized repeat protein (TIGR01451 family)